MTYNSRISNCQPCRRHQELESKTERKGFIKLGDLHFAPPPLSQQTTDILLCLPGWKCSRAPPPQHAKKQQRNADARAHGFHEEESKICHFQVVCVSVGLHHFPKLLRSLDPALENLS